MGERTLPKHGEIFNLSPTARAYIAGLLDADGTITVSARDNRSRLPTGSPLVMIVNSNFKIIEWLKATIGAGTSHETKGVPTRTDQDKANWNCVHRYQITGSKALSLVKAVREFLIIKSRQADLLLEFPVRGISYKLTCPPDLAVKRIAIVHEIRFLNRRGSQRQQHDAAYSPPSDLPSVQDVERIMAEMRRATSERVSAGMARSWERRKALLGVAATKPHRPNTAKLKPEQVAELRSLYAEGSSFNVLGSRIGVHPRTVADAVIGRGAYRTMVLADDTDDQA